MEFIAFDVETTGIVAGVDQIVELGAVKFKDGKPEGVFSTLINPEQIIPEESIRVHNITNEMVQSQPKIHQVLPNFTEFCKDSIMVAHNAPFDVQFIKAAYEKHQIETPKVSILDTLILARKIFKGLPNYKLVTLTEYLKIPSTGFHRAQDDALYCAKVFLNILHRVFQNSSFELEKMANIMEKPLLTLPKITNVNKQMSFF